MVVLMASAVAAAASASAGKKVFSYNRDNFLEDREQRMKKEFAERKFRVQQAMLWREDVRHFVSLTEKKMSLYLLVGVLLLSFNVNLWVEGRLPEDTAEWLTMGMQIAIAVSFLFLLLAVWLAMHAAVSAQAYQTRVLTQLVRLPIPSWEELESCRTAASDYERLEPKQMFRVPFVSHRKQEDIAANHAPLPTVPEGPDGDPMATDFINEERRQQGPQPQAPELPAADPWGLERSGADVYELGAHYGESVAKLRHIKLMRQAAVYWQTYDAFARVSMSVGTNQLLLAMSYYILGYALGQVRAPVAAWAGVSILVFASFLLAQVDLTLSMWEKHLFHICLAFGPVVASIAVYRWSQHSVFAEQVADLLAPLAFIAHGIVVGLMTLFVKVRTQENGAIVPLAFQKVLFLDVFGWVWHKHTQPEHIRDNVSIIGAEEYAAASPSAGSERATSTAGDSFRGRRDSTVAATAAGTSAAAAVASATPAMAVAKARPHMQAPSYASTTTAPPPATGSRSPAPARSPPMSESGIGSSAPDVLGYYADDYLNAPAPESDLDMNRQSSLEWSEPETGSDSTERRRRSMRPSYCSIVYDELGEPLASRPDDVKPEDSVHDMRLVSGAPRMWDQVNAIEPPGRQFWDPVSFMPAEDRNRRMMDNYFEGQGEDEGIETGHDREAPGLVPWRIFQNAAGVTSFVWIFAGVYWMLRATNMMTREWKHWLGTQLEDVEEKQGSFVDLAQRGFFDSAYARATAGGLAGAELNFTSWRALEGPVPAAWPYPSMAPASLACDATGRHLLVLDGVSLYHADLAASRPARPPAPAAPRGKASSLLAVGRGAAASHGADLEASATDAANFAPLEGCEALRGQALDDAAIICGDDTDQQQQRCEVIVLHGRGRRITSCMVAPGAHAAQAASADGAAVAAVSAPLAFQWLRQGEMMRWLVMDPDCAAEISSPGAAVKAGCVSVATTQGRVAQLELSALSGQLNPDEVFDASPRLKGRKGTRGAASKEERRQQAAWSKHLEIVRPMGSGAVGLLQTSGHDVRIVDKATMGNGERLSVARVRLPISQAVGSFCVGGGELYMLEQGQSPVLRRFPFAKSLGRDLLLDYGSVAHLAA